MPKNTQKRDAQKSTLTLAYARNKINEKAEMSVCRVHSSAFIYLFPRSFSYLFLFLSSRNYIFFSDNFLLRENEIMVITTNMLETSCFPCLCSLKLLCFFLLLNSSCIISSSHHLNTMVLPASDMLRSPADPKTGGAYEKVEVVMTTVQSLDHSDFLIMEKPKMMTKERSLLKERQISVDPLSMNESGSPSSPLPPSPKSPTPKGTFQPLPPLAPTKYRFLTTSLSNSAPSSPRLAFVKSKARSHNQVSPLSGSLARQNSVALSRLAELREKHLQRSKSCGEGRASAPNDDFDLWVTNVNNAGHSPRQISPKHISPKQISPSFSAFSAESNRMYTHSKSGKEMYKSYDENFKCGALCIYLPGFGKGKPVRSRREEPEPYMGHVISRTVSLEKFECGSWTSSAIINDHDGDGESSNLYFDLPLELIRSSNNDASSPVSSAFVFDKDLKGVLKNGTSKGAGGGKSGESSRHVRFSTSSPTAYPTSPSSVCDTPRLRKAREEFNAFLDAQSA